MNYGELRTFFLDLLNRDDCTDAQADTFISMGIRRTERVLRTPLQRTLYEYTVVDPWAGSMPVPSDYLSMYSLTVNDVALRRETISKAGPQVANLTAESWFIANGNIYFRGDVVVGDIISVYYYNEFTQGVADTATTSYSAVLPDLITFSALIYAAIHFTDARKGEFEGMTAQLTQEIQMMSDIDEMSGSVMQIRNPYEGII